MTRQEAEKSFVATRAESSIVAATTLMEQHTVEVDRLRKALSQIEGPITKSAEEHSRETAVKMREATRRNRNLQQHRDALQRVQEFQDDLQPSALEYVLALLRYYRQDFDSLPRYEQVGLILFASQHLNEVLGSVRKLIACLEHGKPQGLSNRPVTAITRDVRAAVLSEVAGLSAREVGEELSLPLPQSSRIKGGHDTASKSIERGRAFLEDLLGEEGWRERRDSMKAEAERYNVLSEEERHIEDLAESWGVSKEEARERYKHRTPRFPYLPSGLSGIPQEELLDHLRDLEEEGR